MHLQWVAKSIRLGLYTHHLLPGCSSNSYYHNQYSTTAKMGRHGLELTPQMRSRLCELKSVGMSYSRIHAIHPKSTIKSTYQIEARRVNHLSLPQQGAPHV